MKNSIYIFGLITVFSLNSCTQKEATLTKGKQETSDVIEESKKDVLTNEISEVEKPTTQDFDMNQHIGKDARDLLANDKYLDKIKALLGDEKFTKLRRNLKYSEGIVQVTNDSINGKCIYITGYDERSEGSLYEGIFVTDESMSKVWAAATTDRAIMLQYPNIKENEDVLPEVYKTWVKENMIKHKNTQ
jgi:hypothetical protein